MRAPPDLVVEGGSVLAVGSRRPVAASVAVRGDRIVAVGDHEDVRALVGPRTERVDARGRLVVPGFTDAHVHPVMAGVDLLRCSLHGTRGAQECLDLVAAYAAAHPGLPWVVGSGWSMAFFPGGTPTRQALDAVVGDRPVLLTNRDGHGAWVNTAALRRAGVDSGTPDPADGRIEREPDGHPSGTLHEGAADLVQRVLPAIDDAQRRAGLLEAQRVLLSLGVTAWQDAAVGEAMRVGDILGTYLAADAAGELRARVVGALWWERERGLDQVTDLVERRAAASGGTRFRATSVKIMQDGVAENFTAAMTAPYLDAHGHPTDNAGLSFVDPAALRGYVTALDAAGFQVHVHALGDRAVREALDAVEAARAANGPQGADNRHHLAHLQLVHPDDVPRFAALAVAANIQAFWAVHEEQMDELTIPFLGPERAGWQYPFEALRRAGARLVAGSDWHVSTADPLQGIHVAVNRTAPGAGPDARPFLPHQALGLPEAFAAYTSGSAWANHAEGETGSLAPGYLADLAVLDRDPFAGPPDGIGATRVWRTYVGGELLHDAEA